MSGLSILLPKAQDDDNHAENMGRLPAPAQPASPVLGIRLQGGKQVSLGEQAQVAGRIALREAWRRFNELRRRKGGLLHSLFNERPPTLQEECEYAQSRAWVPSGHEGGFAEAHGILFHWAIGRPMVAAGNLISGIGHKPLRWLLTAFFVFALTLTGLCVAGESGIATWLGLAVAVLAVVWCLVAEVVRHSINPRVIGSGDDTQPHA